jgi:hypothetical protein
LWSLRHSRVIALNYLRFTVLFLQLHISHERLTSEPHSRRRSKYAYIALNGSSPSFNHSNLNMFELHNTLSKYVFSVSSANISLSSHHPHFKDPIILPTLCSSAPPPSTIHSHFRSLVPISCIPASHYVLTQLQWRSISTGFPARVIALVPNQVWRGSCQKFLHT